MTSAPFASSGREGAFPLGYPSPPCRGVFRVGNGATLEWSSTFTSCGDRRRSSSEEPERALPTRKNEPPYVRCILRTRTRGEEVEDPSRFLANGRATHRVFSVCRVECVDLRRYTRIWKYRRSFASVRRIKACFEIDGRFLAPEREREFRGKQLFFKHCNID